MSILTTILAVWGAVVSTAAIVWNIVRDLNDRGKLNVLVYIGEVVGSVDPADYGSKLVYRVTNTGKRPIMVTHLGGALRKGPHFMIPTRGPLPRMLQPGEYILEYARAPSVLGEDPVELWAVDSTNKHWKIPRKQLRRLLDDSRKEPTGQG